MSPVVYLNGKYLPEKEAVLHVSDLSFQRGYGVFDFLRLVEQRPLFLDDHLRRFYRSAAALRLPVPLEHNELREAVIELVDRNQLSDVGIRLGLTGGYSGDGFGIGSPNLVIVQRRFAAPTAAQQATGLRLLSYPYQRSLPGVKSIDYLMAVWLQHWLAENGADDVLYHREGWISECPRSNFFLVTADGCLVAPKENALAGVTRQKILELAGVELPVEERPVHLSEISTAREAFITSTTKRLLPVRQIDNVVLKERAIGNRLLGQFVAAFG